MSKEKLQRCASLKDETTMSANVSQQILFICQLIKIFTTSQLKMNFLKKIEEMKLIQQMKRYE